MTETGDQLKLLLNNLQRESDRGLALIASANIEKQLSQVLHSFLRETATARLLLEGALSPLSSLSAKLAACHALGLIDDFEYREINLIRKIRNKFAHSSEALTYSSLEVSSLCQELRSDLPDDGSEHNNRGKFMNSAIKMSLHLMYRSPWVKKEKRTEKVWVTREMVRWRSIAEENPKDGDEAIVFGRLGQNRVK
jgi:mannitol operon repressor